MSDNSTIEWTSTTWNVVTGCTRVSEGCDHCYIERTMPFRTTRRRFDHDGIGGTTGVLLHPDRLDKPLHWRKPRKVFVNSLADLFHDDVPSEFIARTFAVMALAPQHTFQCLTKRPARMRSLLSSQAFRHDVARAMDAVQVNQAHDPRESWQPIPEFTGYEASSHGRVRGPAGLLAASLNPQTGRPHITLWNHGEPRTVSVHRLVLAAHRPSPDAGMEVCHRNGDKTDNRLANLRWGTRSENQQDKVRHGSRGGPQRLTLDEVAEIRAARRRGLTQQAIADQYGISRPLVSMIEHGRAWAEPDLTWPLPNVHLGVSAENQKWADIRIPLLLATPAAVRWVSAEPLLGPIELNLLRYFDPGNCACEPTWGTHEPACGVEPGEHWGLDWVVVGGESGPGARPMEAAWAERIVRDCRAAGVRVFVKQLGTVLGGKAHHDIDTFPAGLQHREYPTAVPA